MTRDTRTWLLDRAQAHFIRAASALTDVRDRNGLAYVLVEAAVGIHLVAQADQGDAAKDLAIGWIRKHIRTRESAPADPRA